MIRAFETTPDSITIRDAVPEEAACLAALALRSKAHWGYSREFIQSCENELTYQASQIADDKHHFAVAELDSVIVGFYGLESISARQSELEALFVEPKYIGKGTIYEKNWNDDCFCPSIHVGTCCL